MRAVPFHSPQQLGALVRAARERAELSQSGLASRAGVARQWVVLLETGRLTNPTLSHVFRVLGALELELQVAPETPAETADLDDLLGRT